MVCNHCLYMTFSPAWSTNDKNMPRKWWLSMRNTLDWCHPTTFWWTPHLWKRRWQTRLTSGISCRTTCVPMFDCTPPSAPWGNWRHLVCSVSRWSKILYQFRLLSQDKTVLWWVHFPHFLKHHRGGSAVLEAAKRGVYGRTEHKCAWFRQDWLYFYKHLWVGLLRLQPNFRIQIIVRKQ